MFPPPDIWDGGWYSPGDHSSRIEDVFCDDATAEAEIARKAATRAPGFTATRPRDNGVTER